MRGADITRTLVAFFRISTASSGCRPNGTPVQVALTSDNFPQPSTGGSRDLSLDVKAEADCGQIAICSSLRGDDPEQVSVLPVEALGCGWSAETGSARQPADVSGHPLQGVNT
jgi:hypothetical protein